MKYEKQMARALKNRAESEKSEFVTVNRIIAHEVATICLKLLEEKEEKVFKVIPTPEILKPYILSKMKYIPSWVKGLYGYGEDIIMTNGVPGGESYTEVYMTVEGKNFNPLETFIELGDVYK